MASRLHALQNLSVKQNEETATLGKAIDAAGEALDAAETAEEKTAKKAKLSEVVARANTLADEIIATNAEIKALEKLAAAEREAPAVSIRGPLVATPRVEQDPKRGFASIGEFALSVRLTDPHLGGRVDERLAVAFNDTGTGKFGAVAPTPLHQENNSSDGYMVPPDFRTEIWRPAFEMDDLLPLVNPQPTGSNAVQFYTDETTPWGAAGVVAYWVAEGVQMTGSKVATKAGELALEKIGCLVNCTDEILEDAPLLTARINEAAPQAIGWAVGEAIMRGNGAGKPLGWESAACKVSVAKETSQTATTIVAKNITKMYARLLAGPGSRITWFANRDIVPELIDLKIGNEPSWVAQNQGMRDAPNGLLLGVPIRFSEHCKTLGTTGDIQLVNLAGYAAFIKSGGTKFDSSIHLYFDYNITAFRWTMRVGGQPYLSAAVSPANGSNTKSHFVYLDTRS
jgi:HK97 family phage major capsid protein